MGEVKYGVINEIGDMGLGFEELNKKDQKVYHEYVNGKKDDRSQIINENKDKKN